MSCGGCIVAGLVPNVVVTTEQVMKPVKLVAEAPTPDLYSGYSRTIR
jgi:hypothetical protein